MGRSIFVLLGILLNPHRNGEYFFTKNRNYPLKFGELSSSRFLATKGISYNTWQCVIFSDFGPETLEIFKLIRHFKGTQPFANTGIVGFLQSTFSFTITTLSSLSGQEPVRTTRVVSGTVCSITCLRLCTRGLWWSLISDKCPPKTIITKDSGVSCRVLRVLLTVWNKPGSCFISPIVLSSSLSSLDSFSSKSTRIMCHFKSCLLYFINYEILRKIKNS